MPNDFKLLETLNFKPETSYCGMDDTAAQPLFLLATLASSSPSVCWQDHGTQSRIVRLIGVCHASLPFPVVCCDRYRQHEGQVTKARGRS